MLVEVEAIVPKQTRDNTVRGSGATHIVGAAPEIAATFAKIDKRVRVLMECAARTKPRPSRRTES
jgi:hypothetical protein